MGGINSQASFPNLIRLAKDQSFLIRGAAISALVSLNNSNAIPTLLFLLDNNIPTNGNLIDAIGKLGDETCIESLIDLMAIGAGSETQDSLNAIGKITNTDMSHFISKWKETWNGKPFIEFKSELREWWKKKRQESNSY